jgi:hypothetical protein
MADSRAFEFVCTELERLTNMTRLEARGTVRLALKEAGLSADSVLPLEMQVVLQKLMPKELSARAIATADDICRKISAGVAALKETAAAPSPEAVFSRLGGG